MCCFVVCCVVCGVCLWGLCILCCGDVFVCVIGLLLLLLRLLWLSRFVVVDAVCCVYVVYVMCGVVVFVLCCVFVCVMLFCCWVVVFGYFVLVL